jgi:hypothetical protein
MGTFPEKNGDVSDEMIGRGAGGGKERRVYEK